MRKLIVILGTFLSVNLSLLALQPCCRLPDWPPTWEFDIGTGYREDNLHWVVETPGGPPEIASHVSWKKVRSWEVYGRAAYVSCMNYAVKVSGDYSWIYQGRNRDSDYFVGEDHKVLFSRSINDAGKGYTWDASGALGYKFTSTGGRCTITPFIGFSNHEQQFHIYNGNQVVNLVSDFLGRLSRSHNSSYHTRWYGPWGGFDFDVRVECCVNWFGSFEWHLAKYKASGRWNLRREFAGDFRHHADGRGWIARTGVNWEFLGCWTIGFLAEYRQFRTQSGDDITPLLTADGVIDVESKLRDVRWHCYRLIGTLTYRF